MLLSHPSSAFSAGIISLIWSYCCQTSWGLPWLATPSAVWCSSGWTVKCLSLQVSLLPVEAPQKTKPRGSKRQWLWLLCSSQRSGEKVVSWLSDSGGKWEQGRPCEAPLKRWGHTRLEGTFSHSSPCLFQIGTLCKFSLKWKTPSWNHLGLPLSQALHLELFQTVVPLVLRNLLPTSRQHLFMKNLHLLIFLLILSGFYPSLLCHRWLMGLLLPFICHRIFQSPQWDKTEHITSKLYNGIYPPLSSASVSSRTFQDWLCASFSLVK